MLTPLVSVLVPSYNAEQFLPECLESALAQTYPNVEIIVVDDGSTDASLRVARAFENRGVRVLSQDNQGQSGALNTAISASRGDYLQFLDADDILHPQKIEIQIRRLAEADPAAVAAGAWGRFKAKVAQAQFVKERVWQDMSPVEWLVESWRGGGMMHVAGWLVPRRVAEAAGPWVVSLRWAANLDGHFFTRVLLASSRYLFCPEAKSYYRSGHQSMSSWRSRRSLEAVLKVLVDSGEALLSREDSQRTRAAFADNLQRFIFATYPDGLDLVVSAETHVERLGGSGLEAQGGRAFKSIASLFGWKTARRLQRFVRGAARQLLQSPERRLKFHVKDRTSRRN